MNINVEIDKNCGFITFENIDEANMAIDQMNKKTVDGIELQVSIARRQPHVAAKAVQEQSSVAAINSWSAIATTFSRKVRDGNKAQSSDSKETREQIVYDDLF
ncbi:Negative elongation factor E [Halotydeus destructor]|nr:Negative elongation factor E [Halotydeus destructor]